MSSFFNCLAYEDTDSTIRIYDRVVYLALENAQKNSSVHLTLNPFQVRTLVKYLALAISQIDFADLRVEQHFGDFTVRIEHVSETDDCNDISAAS